MTLSMPVKIVALAALALALGLAGTALMLKGHAKSSAGSSSVVVPPAVVVHTPVHTAVKPRVPKIKLDPSLPSMVRHALLRKPVAVVGIYDSRSGGDLAVLAAARQGAHDAHAGFVAANVAHEAIASAVATWSSSVADPGVIVVRRPGKIVFTATGPTDSETIAQAASSAR